MGKEKALTYKCHRISGGSTEGPVLISPEPLCFYMIDTDTGKVSESGHALVGQSITGKILVLPSGKGSSVVQDEGLFGLKQKNTGPKGIIVKNPDTVLVAGTIVMDYPLFDRADKGFYEDVENDDFIKIDADRGLIMLMKKQAQQ